jgi:hypothetical protein
MPERMRAKRPDESWDEYNTAVGNEPVKGPDPNRSGPPPGDHVSVDPPTPQHNLDKPKKKETR